MCLSEFFFFVWTVCCSMHFQQPKTFTKNKKELARSLLRWQCVCHVFFHRKRNVVCIQALDFDILFRSKHENGIFIEKLKPSPIFAVVFILKTKEKKKRQRFLLEFIDKFESYWSVQLLLLIFVFLRDFKTYSKKKHRKYYRIHGNRSYFWYFIAT